MHDVKPDKKRAHQQSTTPSEGIKCDNKIRNVRNHQHKN